MTQELSKNLVCIVIRGGIEIWAEEERAESLKQALLGERCPQFIQYDNKFINKADITGIFDAITMEEKTRRKNGEWQCKEGNWHERFQKCECWLEKRRTENMIDEQEFFRTHGYYPLR